MQIIKNITKCSPLMWEDGDALCISVVFTWDLPIARRYADSLRHRRVRMGGPAIELAKRTMPGFFLGCHAELGGSYPGVLQKFNPLATRTSVGCIRQCAFCSVPLVEGADTLEKFGKRQVPLEDWPDFPVIFDNNFLANSTEHVDRVCDRLEKHGWCDFNQGTDARLVTEHNAERIARIKRPMVRLALDSMSYVDAWDRALERLLRAGVAKRNIRTYALIGIWDFAGTIVGCLRVHRKAQDQALADVVSRTRCATAKHRHAATGQTRLERLRETAAHAVVLSAQTSSSIV